MKHKVTWQLSGTIEFESDETKLDKIAADFITAADEGLDFMRLGDVYDFSVQEVDEQHIHHWFTWHSMGISAGEKCYRCGARQPHEHDWQPHRGNPGQEQCRTCFEKRSTS